jgi:diacylglycerol kinase family enzyme
MMRRPQPTGCVRPPLVKPAVIINPRSGGGKAERHDLVAACRARGIDPILFAPGDDLSALAAEAVHAGADGLGMAGGDGSQAAVAAVAIAHDLPFACIPAGTRNHFAFDIGVDRGDVVGALDALVDANGDERRIDVARVNGRLFVNNVAMGFYGALVESPGYREHKVRAVIGNLSRVVGPTAEPFDLEFLGADGGRCRGAQLLLVSNDPYEIAPRPGQGTRGRLDAGVLGVVAVTGPPPHGPTEWSTRSFRVESRNAVSAGVDGESVRLDPPLLFESVPGALRVRTARRRERPPGPSAHRPR